MKYIFLILIFFTLNLHARNLGKPVHSIVTSVSGTNIPSGSWVEIDADLDAGCGSLHLFNSTPQPVYLGTGASGQEQEIPYHIAPNQIQIIDMPLKKGIRLVARSDNGNLTTGFLIINCLQ